MFVYVSLQLTWLLQVPAAMLETPAAIAVAAASLLQPMLQLAAIPIKATVPAATAGHIAIVAKIIPAWQKVSPFFIPHIWPKCILIIYFRREGTTYILSL